MIAQTPKPPLYIGDGDVAYNIDNTPICRRIFHLDSDTPIIKPVLLRLYYTKEDIDLLLSAVLNIDSFSNLNIAQVFNSCENVYQNNGDKQQITAFGMYGENYYLDIQVTEFSSFFLIPFTDHFLTTIDIRKIGVFKLKSNIIKNEVEIINPKPNAVLNYQIFTTKGEKVISAKGPLISTKHLPIGIYFITNGVHTEKFLKL